MIEKDSPQETVMELARECRKCANCCKVDSGYLVNDDLRRISEYLGITEDKLSDDYLEEFEKFNTTLSKPKIVRKGKPYGKCIFLIDGLCSIHEVKPLYCRLVNCGPLNREMIIWFDLNYFVDVNDPESIRQYAFYLKHGPTIKGGELRDLVPDEEKLNKILSYDILK